MTPLNAAETHTILWRWLDEPGHDAARLYAQGTDWHLGGTAVFSHQGQPGRLGYFIVCDANWNTVRATVSGWMGSEAVEIEIAVDEAGRWRMNGAEVPGVAGCTDLDLNFSPVTNLLPIRRLALPVGGEAPVRAAWLRFPSFTLEPLEQVYRRLGEHTYRYESNGGRFVADLEVNQAGFVTDYPGIWKEDGKRNEHLP